MSVKVKTSSLCENDEYDLEEEVELLKSIYVHELHITRGDGPMPQISIDLHPATADKTDKQFVKLTLVFTLPPEYPSVVPEIAIRNPRGLSDQELEKITDELLHKAEQHKGGQALYQLIEAAKEHLTCSNTPSGQCAVCLFDFTATDILTKTACYHHFHAYCLAQYIQAMMKQAEEKEEKPGQQEQEKLVICPVCREHLDCDLDKLESAPQPQRLEEAPAFELTTEIREKQKLMAALFQEQLSRGGIIDQEAERKKFLIEISTNHAGDDDNAESKIENKPNPVEQKLEDADPAIVSCGESTLDRREPADEQSSNRNSQRKTNDYVPRSQNSASSPAMKMRGNYRHNQGYQYQRRQQHQSRESENYKDRNSNLRSRFEHNSAAKNSSLADGNTRRDVDVEGCASSEATHEHGSARSQSDAATTEEHNYRGRFKGRGHSRGRGGPSWKRNDGKNRNFISHDRENGSKEMPATNSESTRGYRNNNSMRSDGYHYHRGRGQGRDNKRNLYKMWNAEEDRFANDFHSSANSYDGSTTPSSHQDGRGAKIKGLKNNSGRGPRNSRFATGGNFPRKDVSSAGAPTYSKYRNSNTTTTTDSMRNLKISVGPEATDKSTSNECTNSGGGLATETTFSRFPPAFRSEKNKNLCVAMLPPPGFQTKPPFPRAKPPPGFTGS